MKANGRKMEDLYIELYGQDPMYVYLRKIKGIKNISYDQFLIDATGSFEEMHEAGSGAAGDAESDKDRKIFSRDIQIMDDDDSTQTEAEQEVVSIQLCADEEEESIADRISKRIDKSPRLLYDLIKNNSVKEWKQDINAFYSWFDEEMVHSEGNMFLRINANEPYGPENCVLTFRALSKITEPLNSKYSTDFEKLWRTTYDKAKGNIDPVWKSKRGFIHWILNHQDQICEFPIIVRTDSSKPYGPDNTTFKSVDVMMRKKYSQDELNMIRAAREIGAVYNVDPVQKYKTLCSCGDIDPAKWPLKEYLFWVVENGKNDTFAPYLNRLDNSRPYFPDNCFYSWRNRNLRTHGMSHTKLYRKYSYFVRYYREHLESKVSFEEFMEVALKEKDYQINSRMKVDFKSDKVSTDDIVFTSNESDMGDINRICEIYRTQIRTHVDGFGGLMEFMEWTIRQGYAEWFEFKKVKEGDVYSPETCVWDVFTADAYAASKGKRTAIAYKKKRRA